MIPRRSNEERPSTYIVQDRSNREEQKRLQLQDRLLTTALGGTLSEQAEPERFDAILDVACGTGGWLIELAEAYPMASQLVGIDISKRMVEIAREEAQAHQVQDRVTFQIMDALDLQELPENSFDLTNMRLATSFLRTWEWSLALRQMQRVTKPGGIIRMTEADMPSASSSSAMMRLFSLAAQAYSQAGKHFRPEDRGVSGELFGLLEQQGLQNVQARVYTPQVCADTPHGYLFFEDMKYLFRTNVPFLQKWIKLPADYEEIYKQMLRDMQQPDFFATNQTVTAWGMKPL